jgi:hypothetical protein
MIREAASDGGLPAPGDPEFELIFAARPPGRRSAHRRQLSLEAGLSLRELGSGFEPIFGADTVPVFRAVARAPPARAASVVTIDHEISPEILAKAEAEFDVGRFHIGRSRRGNGAPPGPAVGRGHD